MAQATVSSFSALKLAAQDVNIDYIYLDADIVLEVGGILLSKNKPSLVIDGINPLDPTATVHTITDINDNAQSNTIRVSTDAGTYHLTLKNTKFIGHNYYGAISSALSGNQVGTHLTLENVEYSGPQAAYNRYGIIEIIGGNYRIGKFNGTSASTNELAECNRIIMSGHINVYHDGTPNSCMYLTETDPSFEIRSGAILNVETTGREMFYVDAGGMNFTMRAHSIINANMNWSMFYSSGMSAKSFIMEEGAHLNYNQRSDRACATINCTGNLSLAKDTKLIAIKKNFSSSQPIIQFASTSVATFTDPEGVVLYNASGKTIAWAGGTGTVNIDAEIINYWQTATAFPDAGGFNDNPLYNWTKANGDNATITATLNSYNMLSVNTNLTTDDAPIIPTNSTFNLQTARVLAFGKLPVEIETPHENDSVIIGSTLLGANMRASINSVREYSAAELFGIYTILVDPPLEKNDSILIETNLDFKTKRQNYSAEGTIVMTVPETLPFTRIASPTRSGFYGRLNADWRIVVRDSRENGSAWSIAAHATSPLSSDTAQLTGALVFKSGRTVSSIEGLEPVVIYEGEGNTDPDYTETIIEWSQVEGLVISLSPNTSYESGRYQASITFNLVEDDETP